MNISQSSGRGAWNTLVQEGSKGAAHGERKPLNGGLLCCSQDPLRQMLAQIWTRILKVPPVCVEDNFFELRGYSLLARRVISEREKLCHIR